MKRLVIQYEFSMSGMNRSTNVFPKLRRNVITLKHHFDHNWLPGLPVMRNQQ